MVIWRLTNFGFFMPLNITPNKAKYCTQSAEIMEYNLAAKRSGKLRKKMTRDIVTLIT